MVSDTLRPPVVWYSSFVQLKTADGGSRARNDLPRTREYAFLPGESYFTLQIQCIILGAVLSIEAIPLWVSRCSVRLGAHVETESSLCALTWHGR
jgi:hypothetical protein